MTRLYAAGGRPVAGWTSHAMRYAVQRGRSGAVEIKGAVSAEPLEGYVPGFSASGQDVWLPNAQFAGDGLVLSAVGARSGKVFRARGRWGVVANTQVFLPRPGFSADYLWYVLNQEELWWKGGAAQPYVMVPLSLSQYWAFPPLHQQRAIANFLDRKTAAIDALIEKKERLIALLQEKRQALITQAVTAEGQEAKLGYYVDLLPGYAFSSSGFLYADEGVRLLRGVNIGPGRIRWDDVVRWPADQLRGLAPYVLEAGDVVIGMDRPWISGGMRVARIADEDVPCLLLQRVARLRARAGLRQDYLELLLASEVFKRYFEPIVTGVSVPHISPGQIEAFRCCVPTIEYQDRVLSQLRREFEQIDKAAARLREQIGHLHEYRKALITAAVTGQIDVVAEDVAA